MSAGLGCQRERRHLHPLVDEQRAAVAGVGGVGAQVHAEPGAAVRVRVSAIAPRSCSKSIVPDGEDPERRPRSRSRRRGGGRRPSPCRSARSAPGSRTGRTARCAASGASAGQLALALAGRVEHLAQQPAAPRRWAAGSWATGSGTTSSKPVASRTMSTVTPGCRDADPHRWSSVSKSNTPRLEIDAADRRGSGRRSARRPRPGRSRRPTRSRRRARTPAASGSGPSSWSGRSPCCRARRARRAAAPSGAPSGPMQAMFWFPNRSIWVAPIITWRRPDQTTSNICPNGHPALDDLAVRRRRRAGSARRAGGRRRRCRRGRARRCARRGGRRGSGIVPIGLARISPSPRNASAQATTHTSARVTSSLIGHRPDASASRR